MNNKTGIAGILTYDQYLAAQRHNGIKLFNFLMNEDGTESELTDLITRESLLQLVFHTIDHAKTVRAMANATKSNLESIEARNQKIALLHHWLDQHIDEYKGNLDACAHEAAKKIKGLGRSPYWCRQEIGEYRKLKKQGASNP